MTTLHQFAFAKGEVSPELFGRVDTAMYKVGLKSAKNMWVRTKGGIVNRPGTHLIGHAISDTSISILRRFQFKTSDTYMLEFSASLMRVIRDGAHVLETSKAITGATAANPVVLTVAGHSYVAGEDVEIAGVAGMTRLNGRRFRVLGVLSANTFSLLDLVTGLPLDGTGYAAYTSGGTAARVYQIATPYAEADLRRLKFVQSADTMTITHPSYDERKLTRTAHTSWTLTVPTFAPAIAAPGGLSIFVNSAGVVTATYVVTAVNDETGEESLASAEVSSALTATPSDNTVLWGAVSGATSYNVYKEVNGNGVFGYVGNTPDLQFREVNIAPALTITPPKARNPFSGAGNKPAASTYFQQRHVRGGSTNAPDTEYYSQTGLFYNMSVSTPSQDNDAITATLVSRQVNEIRHYVPGSDLLVFTAGAEWRIFANGPGFAATTREALPQSQWGSSHIEPKVVGATVLFVPDARISVRSAEYSFAQNVYVGEDLTLLANHIFTGSPMLDWAYGLMVDPSVFAVKEDGTAAVLTYQKEQQVVAWCPWNTRGLFEAVDAVKQSASAVDEVPHFVVRRKIGNRWVRFVEYLDARRHEDVEDCFFVDCGLSFDNPVAITGIVLNNPILITAPGHGLATGDSVDLCDISWETYFDDQDTEVEPDQLEGRYTVTVLSADEFSLDGEDGTGLYPYVSGGYARKPTSTVTGLDHLEGEEVVCLADGNVVSGLTVTDGAVTFARPFSRIHTGLRYISDVVTLSLETPQGSIQHRVKRPSSVTVRFNQSRGLFAGQTEADLVEMKQRDTEDLDDPTALLSGDRQIVIGSTWMDEGQIWLRQRYPLPMNILGIYPDFDIEG